MEMTRRILGRVGGEQDIFESFLTLAVYLIIPVRVLFSATRANVRGMFQVHWIMVCNAKHIIYQRLSCTL
jgi:hypothetical protein